MHYTPCTMRGGRRSHCALIDRTGQPPTFSELRNSAISNDWHGVAIINSKDMVTMMMIILMVMITHFLFMTRLLDGDMQLTLMSVVPCRLQIAIEKRPKFARITFQGTYLEEVQGSAEHNVDDDRNHHHDNHNQNNRHHHHDNHDHNHHHGNHLDGLIGCTGYGEFLALALVRRLVFRPVWPNTCKDEKI